MAQHRHEVAPGTSSRPARPLRVWRKSSYSDNAGNCVEVGGGLTDGVAVRDSKNRGGPALSFTQSAWSAFIAQLRRVGPARR
jgi:hypothetical protein